MRQRLRLSCFALKFHMPTRAAAHSGFRVSTRVLVAVQQTPGWALGVIQYHSSVAATGSAVAAREILTGRIPVTVNVDLNLSLSGRADLVTLAPSYTFATPVLGGQLSVIMSGQYGRAAAKIAGTLTATAGPIVMTRTGMLEGCADLLRGPRTLRGTAMELWRQQLHGLRYRQYSRRRL